MQNEQRLSHPSWTFRLRRVRPLAASKTGAASSSVCAKMSETKSRFSVGSSRFSVSASTGTKDTSEAWCVSWHASRRVESVLKYELAFAAAGENATSATLCLSELRITHLKPDRVAIS